MVSPSDRLASAARRLGSLAEAAFYEACDDIGMQLTKLSCAIGNAGERLSDWSNERWAEAMKAADFKDRV